MQSNPVTERHLNVLHNYNWEEKGWAEIRSKATDEIHAKGRRRRKAKPEHTYADFHIGEYIVIEHKDSNGFLTEFLAEVVEARPYINKLDTYYTGEKEIGVVTVKILHSQHKDYVKFCNALVHLHLSKHYSWSFRFKYSTTDVTEYVEKYGWVD